MNRTTLTVAIVAAAGAGAQAQTLTETFDDPFGDWTGRWLHQNSNAGSYYYSSGSSGDLGYRGNNPEGLWITDTQGFSSGVGGDSLRIDFDHHFAITLQELEFGIEAWLETEVNAYDMSGDLIGSQSFSGGGYDFDHQDLFSVTSDNGISHIVMTTSPFGGGQVEGNTSVDNFRVTIPTPASAALVCLGGLVMTRRRRLL